MEHLGRTISSVAICLLAGVLAARGDSAPAAVVAVLGLYFVWD